MSSHATLMPIVAQWRVKRLHGGAGHPKEGQGDEAAAKDGGGVRAVEAGGEGHGDVGAPSDVAVRGGGTPPDRTARDRPEARGRRSTPRASPRRPRVGDGDAAHAEHHVAGPPGARRVRVAEEVQEAAGPRSAS